MIRILAKRPFVAVRAGLAFQFIRRNERADLAVGAAIPRISVVDRHRRAAGQAKMGHVVADAPVKIFMVGVIRVALLAVLVQIVRIAVRPCLDRTAALVAFEPCALCHPSPPH